MKTITRLRALTMMLCLCGVLPLPLSGQDAAGRIKSEVTRLRQSLKDNPVRDPEFAPLTIAAQDSLRDALDELNAGRIYLSLEKLVLGSDYLQAARAAVDKEEVERGGLSAFEAKWGKANLVLAKLDEEAASRDWSHGPAAIRALSEAAQGRTIPLLTGGRRFATATAPRMGLRTLARRRAKQSSRSFALLWMLARRTRHLS
jgi:hypothetical protein